MKAGKNHKELRGFFAGILIFGIYKSEALIIYKKGGRLC